MPEDNKEVKPVETPVETPKSDEALSGRELLRRARKIDYNEEEETPPAPVAEKKEEKPAAPANAPASSQAPVPAAPAAKDPKELELERLRAAERLKALEAERLKAQNEILLQQQEASRQPEPEVDLNELFQQDPLAAMAEVARRTAKQVREETLAEIQKNEQAASAVDNFQKAQAAFAANIEKVKTENKELEDPNHRLTQIYLNLEQELPFLLTIPEGPIKAIEIAKQRYELELLNTGKHPKLSAQVSDAVKQGQEQEARRQEQVNAASLVAGSNRGVPPSPSVKLTPEEELAARRLRLSPEAYSQFKPRSPKYFKKEEAPRRKVSA